jgi:hypothetical protein
VFERALEDPGENAVRRVVGLFRVSSFGLVASGVLYVLWIGLANPLASGLFAGFSVLCAIGAWVTAAGIESHKRWARNTGVVIATLSLFNFGIGTIFGIIELWNSGRTARRRSTDGDGVVGESGLVGPPRRVEL